MACGIIVMAGVLDGLLHDLLRRHVLGDDLNGKDRASFTCPKAHCSFMMQNAFLEKLILTGLGTQQVARAMSHETCWQAWTMLGQH